MNTDEKTGLHLSVFIGGEIFIVSGQRLSAMNNSFENPWTPPACLLTLNAKPACKGAPGFFILSGRRYKRHGQLLEKSFHRKEAETTEEN